jgi:hypothetical protein
MSSNHKSRPLPPTPAASQPAAAPSPEIEGLEAVRAILFGQQQKAITQQLDNSSSALKQQIADLTQQLAHTASGQTEASNALAVQLNAKIDALAADHSSKLTALQQQFSQSLQALDSKVERAIAQNHTQHQALSKALLQASAALNLGTSA